MRPLNADRLALALQVRGLTQAQLAEKAGLTQTAISNAIRGGRVRPSTLVAIARALYETPKVEGADILAGGDAA